MRRNLRPSTLDNYEKKISTFKIGKVEYFLLFITDFQETLEATGENDPIKLIIYISSLLKEENCFVFTPL